MANKIQNEYLPNYVSAPGETLLEILESIPMTQVELARRIGRTPKLIAEIIMGKAPITPETALLLEKVLGTPASFWNNRECQYQETLARIQDHERLRDHTDWLGKIPLKAMVTLGWVQHFEDKVEQLREVLRFFGVALPDQWEAVWNNPQAAFRKSRAFQSQPGAVAAWLRQGELAAREISCAPFAADHFRQALQQIRPLTRELPPVFLPQLERLCAEAGVAVVFVPELPGIRAHGAARWLSAKAVIQLSLRYKTADHLWFTFFHEAGHILRHGRREVFIEEDAARREGEEDAARETTGDEKEREADRFAADTLIHPEAWKQFATHRNYSRAEIQAFADQVGIAPGIVVGRLQHEGLQLYANCNDLKQRLLWAKDQADEE